MHLHPLKTCLSLYQEHHCFGPMTQAYIEEPAGRAERIASAAFGKTGVLCLSKSEQHVTLYPE